MTVYERLLGLLGQSDLEITRRERQSVHSQMILGSDRLIIYGAGMLGQKIAAGLKANGRPIRAFIDRNSDGCGKSVGGIDVLEISEAARRFSDDLVIVAVWDVGGTTTYDSIESLLREHGFKHIAPGINVLRLYPAQLLPHWKIGLPAGVLAHRADILDAFALWSDDHSRRLFVDHIEYLLSPTHLSWRQAATVEEQYFLDRLVPLSEHESFVDCGAYNGDTGRAFLQKCRGRFDRLTCFEPDPHNFENLTNWRTGMDPALADRIDLFEMAVGDENKELAMDPSGTTGSNISSSGTHRVRCTRLDDMLKIPPTYIKYDIEGFEPHALTGSEATIRRFRPKIAICVYHHQDHLWTVPLQLSRIAESYSFHLEQHGVGTSDTVCYAVPS